MAWWHRTIAWVLNPLEHSSEKRSQSSAMWWCSSATVLAHEFFGMHREDGIFILKIWSPKMDLVHLWFSGCWTSCCALLTCFLYLPSPVSQVSWTRAAVCWGCRQDQRSPWVAPNIPKRTGRTRRSRSPTPLKKVAKKSCEQSWKQIGITCVEYYIYNVRIALINPYKIKHAIFPQCNKKPPRN